MTLPLSAQKKEKKTIDPFDRGIELPNSCFIPRGTVGGGLSISYSQYDLGNAGADDAGYQMLFSLLQGINGNMESFGVAPFVSYFVADNLSVGLRFGYDRTGAYLGNAGVIFGGEEPLLSLENVGYLKQNYSGAATLRNYIPFPNTKRFAMFTELQLGGGYAQSESYRYDLDQETQNTDKFGTYQDIYRFNVGLVPGLCCFVTNEVAIEASIGVLGYEWQKVKQSTNQVEKSQMTSQSASFKINLLSINLGMSFYIPTGAHRVKKAK